MKHLLWLALLLPTIAFGQVNGSIQKTTATGIIRYYNATAGIDSIASVYGIGINGQILIYNSTLKKYVPTTPTYGSGTVTSVAALTLGTTGTDLSSTVATGTTTPVITLNVPTASASNRGVLSMADWSTFNNKLSTSTAASTYVPYTGATGNVNLGVRRLTAGYGDFFNTSLAGGTGIKLFGNYDVLDNPKGVVEAVGETISGGLEFRHIKGNSTGEFTSAYANTVGDWLFYYNVNLPAQTASRVLLTDASKNIVSSSITATTLGYLDATSSIQMQLNAKQATGSYATLTGTETLTNKSISGGQITSAVANATLAANSTLWGGAAYGGPYLPLTGGTLTGALTGTSATFSGNVSIGTTSSYLAKVTISSSNKQLRLQDSDTGTDYWQIGTSSNTNLGFSYKEDDGGLSNILFLTSTGKVGLGTSTGLSKLSINGGLHVGGDSDAGDNNLLVDGNVSAASQTITTAPTTSAGTYDILTRNTSTGVVEKVASGGYLLLSGGTLTGALAGTSLNLSGALDAGQGTFTGTLTAPAAIFNGKVRLKGYTVATLPAGTQGDIAYVTDALAPAFLATVVGGGAIVTQVFYNGTNWQAQ